MLAAQWMHFHLPGAVLHCIGGTNNTDTTPLGIGSTGLRLAALTNVGLPYLKANVCAATTHLQEIHFGPLSNLRFLSALHYAFEGMAQIELGGRLFACPAAGLDSQSAAFLTQLLPGAASLLNLSRLQQLASSQQGCTVDSSAVAGAQRTAGLCPFAKLGW
jgi:hypothetical protein